jgi:hypothetical protein
MPTDFDWSVPPLTPDEQALADAYVAVGRALDDLPYTAEFEELCRRIGAGESNGQRHQTFLKLLRLRKTGRLPRISLLVE